jgi:urease accessory protein
MRELGADPLCSRRAEARASTFLEPAALLSLMRWVSPALPVGAYAYSRGLEQAVTAGWVSDEATTLTWVSNLARDGLARLDVPVLLRQHAAWLRGDLGAVRGWNDFLSASRETCELALEDQQLGMALLRLLHSVGLVEADAWPGQDAPSYVTAFALACTRSGVDARSAALGFLWAACEGQVGAAVRLVPLGQTAGQRVQTALVRELPGLITLAGELGDDALGSTLPALAIASALHETQYTRLFRS